MSQIVDNSLSHYKFLRTRLQNGKGFQGYAVCVLRRKAWILTVIVATVAAKKVQREQKKRVPQIHTHTHFFRPHTLKLARKPKYERTSVAKDNKMDVYAVIKKPVVTESAMKKIEVDCFIRVRLTL